MPIAKNPADNKRNNFIEGGESLDIPLNRDQIFAESEVGERLPIKGTVVTDIDGKKRLKLSIDTEIGDITVEVAPTTNVPTFAEITSVVQNTLTTIVSKAAGGSPIFVDKVQGTGTAEGEWFVFIDAVEKLRGRTTRSEMVFSEDMLGLEVAAGSTLTIKIKHYQGNNQDFQGTIFSR